MFCCCVKSEVWESVCGDPFESLGLIPLSVNGDDNGAVTIDEMSDGDEFTLDIGPNVSNGNGFDEI